MKNVRKTLVHSACALLLAMPTLTQAQMSKVKTVWVILMENHNWTGNNAGASFGAPDLKGNPLAPYINGPLLATRPATIPASRIICGWKPEPTSESSRTPNLDSRNSQRTSTW